MAGSIARPFKSFVLDDDDEEAEDRVIAEEVEKEIQETSGKEYKAAQLRLVARMKERKALEARVTTLRDERKSLKRARALRVQRTEFEGKISRVETAAGFVDQRVVVLKVKASTIEQRVAELRAEAERDQQKGKVKAKATGDSLEDVIVVEEDELESDDEDHLPIKRRTGGSSSRPSRKR